ncbi:MAG: hypothetical protein EBW75_06435, partial [Actinobacteria bacterium]|nr:hypothetical protein [Actinomycetota bacterium]
GSYSGATSVSAGTLAVTHASALGTADGATTVSDGATLAISNGITLAEPLTLYGTGNSANGAIRSTSGNNTISELVTLASAAEVQTDAGSLTFDVGTGNAFTGTFGLTFDAASGVTVTVADPIATSTGTVTKSGLGSLTLSATNTFSGATTISAGTLTVSGSGSLSSGSYGGAITNDGSFVYASSTSQTLSGAISGTGTITKNTSSASRLTLSTSNSYSGSTTVSTGFLAISHANALGATSGATTVANNATLELSGNISSAEPITISGDGVTVSSAEVGAIRSTSGVNTLTGLVTLAAAAEVQADAGSLTFNVLSGSAFSGTDDLTFDANTGSFTVADPIATSSGTVTKTGSGTLTLSAANTYTGATTISAGVVVASNSLALGNASTGTTVDSGAALHVSGEGVSIGEPLTISGTGITSTGAIRNLDASGTNNNSLTGAVILGAAASVASDADTLTFNVSSGNAFDASTG